MIRSAKMMERYVFIDVETTGFSLWRGHRVIEVGAIALEGAELMAEFSALIKVPRAIPFGATQIHGITDEMLIGQPPPEEVFPALAAFIRGSILVAHNAPFDVGFIRHEFERLKLNLTNRHICTLEMSRTRFPHLRNHKLETVYRHLMRVSAGGHVPEARRDRNVSSENASPGNMTRKAAGIGTDSLIQKQTHRALDDARMVAKIWLKLAGNVPLLPVLPTDRRTSWPGNS